MPSINMMARARRPPNAPAAVAALKKMAMRVPHSALLYHIVMKNVTPLEVLLVKSLPQVTCNIRKQSSFGETKE
jgi:hypothetical protein